MFSNSPSVLVIGDHRRPEFVGPMKLLAAEARVMFAESIAAAGSRLESCKILPELIVLPLGRPGLFLESCIARLRQLAPITPVVALLGSWCHGATRTERPLPGVTRVFWFQWPSRWASFMADRQAGRCPDWGLPPVASDEDHLLWRKQLPGPSGQGLIAVATRMAESAEALMAACRQVGYAAAWVRPGREIPVTGITAGIWDGAGLDADEIAHLQTLRMTVGPVPILALLDFPRVAIARRAATVDVAAVLGKPFLLEDLHWQLHRLHGPVASYCLPESTVK